MQLGQALSWTAERFPDRVGVGGPAPLTYRQWDARTNQLARALAVAGASHGSRVVLLLGNGEPLASLHLAAQKLGVASTPLNTRFDVAELAYCVVDADPAVVVTDEETAEVVPSLRERLAEHGGCPRFLHVGRDAPPGGESCESLAARQSDSPPNVVVGPEDPSILLYTAGTTGRPKGVPRTQRNEFSAALAHVVQCGYSLAGEATLGAMPIFHTMGVRSLLAMVLVGGTWSPVSAITPDLVGEALNTAAVSCLYLVPTAYFTLLHGGVFEHSSSVDKLAYAGAPMTPTLAEQLAAAVDPAVFVNHFGSTEVYTYTVSPVQRSKPGCAGRAGIFSRVRLVSPDPEGRATPDDVVGDGHRGEVIVSLASDEAFAGYRNRPEATAAKLRAGWYFTGDLAEHDEDGDLWVAGRVDDMVITGGENVHPVEVEDALAACPDVAEVAVAGVPDDKWGQAVTAFVVPRVPTDPDAAARIEAWVRTSSGLSAFKRPKQIVPVSAIPKSPVGKILRRDLATGDYAPLSSPRSGTVEENSP